MESIKLILDTDIGPDCDDAGAIGLLHILSRKKEIEILAMTHCTSSPYGCGCIDAINIAFGKKDIPIGTLQKAGFLDVPEYYKYNKYIAEKYDNRYKMGIKPAPALDTLKNVLVKAEGRSVTVVSIGPLTNLAELVNDEQGKALVKDKVKLLVSMAGCFTDQSNHIPYAEWNIEMDIKAAQDVIEKWESDIVFTPFETGVDIITGVSWGTMFENHPVRKAYALHSPNGRPSWDLTAIWYAVMGTEPHFILSERGNINIEDDGKSKFTADPTGRSRYLMLSPHTDTDVIAGYIDNLWAD